MRYLHTRAVCLRSGASARRRDEADEPAGVPFAHRGAGGRFVSDVGFDEGVVKLVVATQTVYRSAV